MKEIREILIGQKEKDDATLNYVSREAQVAILNPDLSDSIKEEILNEAVGTIYQIGERRWIYEAIPRKNSELKQSGSIYEAPKDEGEEEEETPSIIVELNENLQKDAPGDMKSFTVEQISESIGISKKILYEWTESDAEFTTALGRLKDVQENDPLKTRTEEDYFVNSMMIALLLMETRDRHYKSENQ
jgi:hypothetical protein